MWHASVSAQDPERGPQLVERLVEREAVRLLRGVGSPDGEWWTFSPGRIGHLRVALTSDEIQQLTPGRAIDDAGETGPYRRRTA